MQNVKLIVLDVDGTLTDGTLLYTDSGAQSKAFHVADGLGIVMAQAVGIRIAILSGRTSRVVETRMAELGVEDVIQNCGDKAQVLNELLEKYHLRAKEAAYVGDDINDLPAFEAAGVKIAVANASEHLKTRADWVTPRAGGAGAVRDAIEEILRRQGRLDEAVAAYLARTKLEEGTARLETNENVLLAFWPRVVTAAMHTTMIRASMTAYSTAVGPSSRLRNLTMFLVMERMVRPREG